MAFRQGWMRLRAQSHHFCFHYKCSIAGWQRSRNGGPSKKEKWVKS